MVTELMMRSRKYDTRFNLDRKLFLSYITIVFITIATSFILFTAFSNSYLVDRLTRSMEATLSHLEETINTHPDYHPTYNYFKEDILKLVQTEMIAVPENGHIVSTLSPSSQTDITLERFQDIEAAQQRYHMVVGHAHNNFGEWTIYLFVERETINSFNEINLTVLLITSAVSMVIASVFGMYAQRNIASPILSLTNKVKEFRLKLTPLERTIFTSDEIQDLDESLVVMADDILGNDRRRKAFFENTSHELKTPLMSIRGYAEGLKDGIFDLDEAADVILAESESLRMMVEDILYLSKLEDASIDRYQFQPLESNEFLTGFYQKMRPIVHDRGLNFILLLDRSAEVNLDDEKMIRALSNIITNAVRYAQTQIVIKTQLEYGYLNIRISNDGPQVPEENLSKLFDRFYKGTNGQSGLGLAIVRTIVAAHKGSAEAFNTENGFCMNIKLPCLSD